MFHSALEEGDELSLDPPASTCCYLHNSYGSITDQAQLTYSIFRLSC